MHASKAIFPSATIAFKFWSLLISSLKKLKQLSSSVFKGLSPGGTHFKAVVIKAFFNLNPSLICVDVDWFDIFALYKHL